MEFWVFFGYRSPPPAPHALSAGTNMAQELTVKKKRSHLLCGILYMCWNLTDLCPTIEFSNITNRNCARLLQA